MRNCGEHKRFWHWETRYKDIRRCEEDDIKYKLYIPETELLSIRMNYYVTYLKKKKKKKGMYLGLSTEKA